MRGILVALVVVAARSAAADPLYLPPAAFAPTNNVADYSLDQGGLGCLRLHKGSAFLLAVIPAPPGTAVAEMTVLFEDVNPDALGLMSLVRRRETSFELLGVTKPSQGTGKLETITTPIDPPAVARPDAALLLQVLLSGPEVCLHGARVRLERSE